MGMAAGRKKQSPITSKNVRAATMKNPMQLSREFARKAFKQTTSTHTMDNCQQCWICQQFSNPIPKHNTAPPSESA
jgi:hypothetical protein